MRDAFKSFKFAYSHDDRLLLALDLRDFYRALTDVMIMPG